MIEITDESILTIALVAIVWIVWHYLAKVVIELINPYKGDDESE